MEEVIYRTDGFPDARFERLYAASSGNVSLSLGGFEDESPTGIVHDPIVQNNRLIVFSSAHVFLWRPGEEPIQFNPFEAEGWYEYAQQGQLNGHYDYLAKAVWENDEQTMLEYECDSCGGGKPETLIFFSLDTGQTFDICLAPAPDYSNCLD